MKKLLTWTTIAGNYVISAKIIPPQPAGQNSPPLLLWARHERQLQEAVHRSGYRKRALWISIPGRETPLPPSGQPQPVTHINELHLRLYIAPSPLRRDAPARAFWFSVVQTPRPARP